MVKAIKTVATLVSSIDEPAPGVKRLVLTDPDGWDLPPFRPGAHVDLHVDDGVIRTYSLCNDPRDNGRYVVAVKLEATGRGGSRYIHEQVKAGDPVGLSLPRGGMPLAETEMNIFVAGGIGVTPFISAIRHLESVGRSNYMLHWSSLGAPSLVDMLEGPLAAGRVKLYDTRTDPLPDIYWIVHGYGDSAMAFCCGPTGMLDAFERAVATWPESRKHIERFTTPILAPTPDAVAYDVVLAKSGKTMRVSPELGLLRTLEIMGADVSVSCAGGICGACRTRWLEGKPIHRDRVLSPTERATDLIVCVAECASERLVLDL